MTFRKQPSALKTSQVTILQLCGAGKAPPIPDLGLVFCEMRLVLWDNHHGAQFAKTITPWKL